MLEARRLTKVFPARRGAPAVRAVEDVSFEVAPGQTLGLLGPNGAGKTTTVRMIAGLLRPSSGDVTVDGVSVAGDPARARARIGLVTESSGLYEKLSADEYLTFFGSLYRLPPDTLASRIAALLTQFELAEARTRRIQTYSKGMRQKLQLARALLHEPKLLLLDEPTSGLDPSASDMLLTVLADLRRRTQVATILCSHNLDEVDRLCDRIAILSRGRVVKEGVPSRLKQEGSLGVVRVTLAAPCEAAVAAVRQLAGVRAVEPGDGGLLRVSCEDEPASVNPRIAKAIVEAGGGLVRMEPETAGLKDVYLRVVQEARA